ncbi:hypothetical protein OE88DRAFT_1807395 [Heliocybe sulcata]|uniref:Aprataxin and PNK-like factor PBZ domain-containing protein n=1 Tax=Heliocybe sulcata TaxID=5364 RepID=A0A5C3N4D6_9AGAM|nr:hypothetical protein OE88DRAFT_1807395 [Heliocybe sulcata]
MNDDLADCVLRALPDFDSLSSVILVSRQIYDVFNRHPVSIVRSVAYNKIGPSLPQALRLARHKKDQYDPVNWPPEAEVMNVPITVQERHIIARNAHIVSQLEDLFSWSHKNQFSTTSVLSNEESKRFHRAMYRFWLFADAFRPEYDDWDGETETFDGPKNSFFQQLPDKTELYEFVRIVQFLTETVRWVGAATGEVFNELAGNAMHMADEMGFALSGGPRVILQMFKDKSGAPLLAITDPWETDSLPADFTFIKTSLSDVFQARNLKRPDWNSHEMKKTILDEYEQYTRPCHLCAKTGDRLWSASNWPFLKGYAPPLTFARSMKGNLTLNRHETNGLQQYLQRPTLCYASFMDWMFDNKDTSGQYRDLTRDDWICQECLQTFVNSKLHLWWLERQRAEGMPVRTEDCWYGYNCRTQRYYTHAMKLNHLCAPTRGDPA